MPRGRPKHPDVLTPREWEVLSLLREGLTNPQIADRLGISENGAKYHVLEILSKLGVSSRYEAAAWQREPAGVSRRYGLIGALLALRPPKLAGLSASQLGTAVLATAVAGFLGLLAVGVIVMDQRASMSAGVEGRAEVVATPEQRLTPSSGAATSPTPEATETPSAAPTVAPNVIPLPTTTAAPAATASPTSTATPPVIVELPAAAAEALEAFAATQGTTFAGLCASGTPQGALCYNPNDGTPIQEGESIRLFMRVSLASLSYEVVVTPDADGVYAVTAATGPNSFTIPPPP